MIRNNTKLFLIFIISGCFLLPVSVLAVANSTGYAWGENIGWANFNSTNGGATVSDAGATGYVWLENVGWIQLDYDGVAGATNTTSTNWGITNDGDGNLGGYAWGENIGWINFHPTNSQVIITSGNFSGYAWSENIGWIKFDHAQTSSIPATTWSVAVTSTPTPTPTPIRGGTGGYYILLPTPTSVPAPTPAPLTQTKQGDMTAEQRDLAIAQIKQQLIALITQVIQMLTLQISLMAR